MRTQLSIYHWKGIHKNGESLQGINNASCVAALKLQLYQQGIMTNKVYSLSLKKVTHKIKSTEINFFFHHTATLLKIGIPLLQALQNTLNNSHFLALNYIIEQLKKDIENGLSLSEALQKFPTVFKVLDCQLILIGEKTANLSVVLERIVQDYERKTLLMSKVKKAMTYPLLIGMFALFIAYALLRFVVPQFSALYESFDAQLPMLTRLLLYLSTWIHQVGLRFFLYLIFLGSMGTLLIKRNAYCARTGNQWLLAMPYFGLLLRKSIWARFSRVLTLCLTAGIPLVDALAASVKVLGNHCYVEALEQICQALINGQSFQLALKKTEVFPNLMIQLVALGEESGELVVMLEKIAEVYEQELSQSIDIFFIWLEPATILGLGLVIGSLIIALYLPIFKLGSLL